MLAFGIAAPEESFTTPFKDAVDNWEKPFTVNNARPANRLNCRIHFWNLFSEPEFFFMASLLLEIKIDSISNVDGGLVPFLPMTMRKLL
jgi:hypothetical protein